MAVSNEETAEIFESTASLLEMKGDVIFKIRAYQRAARTISQLPYPPEQLMAYIKAPKAERTGLFAGRSG